MSKSICPACGSQKVQVFHTPSTGVASSGASIPQALHSIVSYALMGAATAQKFRGSRQPWVLLAGVAVGGVMGCVMSYLNQQNHSPSPEPEYQCQDCQWYFHLAAQTTASLYNFWS